MAKLIISETNGLDGELQELSINNWDEFVNLVGAEAITSAKVCYLRSNGKTIRQIANKLHITKSQVETRCKKCPMPPDRK